MAKVYVGTSGYSYKDWRGVVYPESASPSEYLSLYAREFSFVELNFSYYRRPTPEMCSSFLDKTPDDFIFAIKGHRSMTHDRKEGWKREADEFRLGIAPLESSGRLASVLLQFPYSFHRTRENRLYLSEVCGHLEGLPLAVEFRSREWQLPEVEEGLLERGITTVNVDAPGLENLPVPAAVLTAPLGYVRFHGRNEGSWWTGTNVSRYDYLYESRELEEWVERVRAMMVKAAVLLVAFNNHHKGQAVQNAREFTAMLRTEGVEVPGP